MNTSRPTPDEVRQARNKAGITQDQAADDVHVGIRTWQKYESGEVQMPFGYWELFLLKRGLLWPVNPNGRTVMPTLKLQGRAKNFKKPERE